MAAHRDMRAAAEELTAARAALEQDLPLYRALVAQKATLESLLDVVTKRLGSQALETQRGLTQAANLLPKTHIDSKMSDGIERLQSTRDVATIFAGENDAITETMRQLEFALYGTIRSKQLDRRTKAGRSLAPISGA